MRTGRGPTFVRLISIAGIIGLWIGYAYVSVLAGDVEAPGFIRDYLARRNLDRDVNQLLIAVGRPAPDVRVRVYGLRRHTGDRWRMEFGPLAGTIGYRGYAPLRAKREGDGRSPSGEFAAGFAFGYPPAGRVVTRMPYRQVTALHFWNTDPGSPHYNTWRSGDPGGRDFEHMRRRDNQYKLGLVIRYNMDPVVPGRGSAIFLHIWRGPGKATAGCIGVAEKHMVQILDWLDPAARPMIVMGTEAQIRGGLQRSPGSR